MNDHVPPAPPEPPASQQPMLPSFPSYPTGGIQDDRRMMPPPTTTKAMWALILACLPAVLTWIASVILAIQVLSDSRGGRQNGKGMAIAALVIIPLWIALFVAVIVADSADDADRDATGTVTRSGEVLVNDVRAGDCLDEDFTDEVMYTVDVVPCTEPHALEAYASFDLGAGDFPGEDEVERLGTIGCVKRFTAFVGVKAEKSRLEIGYLLPARNTWSESREVSCVVGEDKATTGSLKNAKR